MLSLPLAPQSSLPSVPGVYAFRSASGVPLYIGKAKRLNTRIQTHLGVSQTVPFKTRLFVSASSALELIPTASEIEAILLEARLISRLRPKYNSRLRDDLSPLYITVTDTQIPGLELRRRKELSGKETHVFGPFASGRDATNILKTVRAILPYCSKKRFDGTPCFFWHLGTCPGVCINRMTLPSYKRRIGQIARFLNGHIDEIVQSFTRLMNQAAKDGQFERAAQFRDALSELSRSTHSSLLFKEDVDATDAADRVLCLHAHLSALGMNIMGEAPVRIEAFDVSRMGTQDAAMGMVVFVDGVPDSSEYRRFRLPAGRHLDDSTVLSEGILRRVGHPEWKTPSLFVIDGGTPQLRAILRAMPKNNPLSKIPIVGLAKEEETLVVPTAHGFTRLSLPRTDKGLQLAMHLRDEAHRFCRRYHHWLRSKRLLGYNQNG